ncbi:MAG TPA: hypothetical protein VN289_25220 [Paraburkholderia sp.]|jgi:hypothetical protein|nr:hypothetical protein [Paraburkholderia sp.]
MNDRPRIPRQPLAPSAKIFAAMFVALFVALFALLMTGAVAGIVRMVRWVMSTQCGG